MQPEPSNGKAAAHQASESRLSTQDVFRRMTRPGGLFRREGYPRVSRHATSTRRTLAYTQCPCRGYQRHGISARPPFYCAEKKKKLFLPTTNLPRPNLKTFFIVSTWLQVAPQKNIGLPVKRRSAAPKKNVTIAKVVSLVLLCSIVWFSIVCMLL
ncbi:transmembrane protein, putative [Bodo saltans]|uniref:Transmembrane protein, putative n=1 Tax=Bodo saltans TaxID=75058 RepID=A0A0S4KI51_BODSA|nr:transmembrane protein, putative [Bodo saltans]|eukprot:CUI14270.1 transmembrane protein, putative [Bodo saltans]